MLAFWENEISEIKKNNIIQKEFCFKGVSSNEVKKVMKIRIPVIFLIGSIDIYSPLLTDVINDSLKRGIFPNEVIPLFKNADPCFKTNCRPVS